MRLKYHKNIVDMLYNEWDLGKKMSHAKGKTCAWIYWFEILSKVEQIIFEKEKNKIIGICGYSKINSKKHFVRKKYYGILRNILIHSSLIKNKQGIYKYNSQYDYLPEKLKKYFDGEITILIVKQSHRGKQIGKKLITEAFQLASKDNLNKLQILSDESCNYKFYDKLGCKKIYEKIVSNDELDKKGNILTEKVFIYEKYLGE